MYSLPSRDMFGAACLPVYPPAYPPHSLHPIARGPLCFHQVAETLHAGFGLMCASHLVHYDGCRCSSQVARHNNMMAPCSVGVMG